MASTKALLGDVVDFINGGAWPQTDYVEKGIGVVRVSDIKQEIDITNLKFVPFGHTIKYVKQILKENDVIICTVGSHPDVQTSVVGRTTKVRKYAEGFLLNQNAVCLRSKSPLLDQEWLYYLSKSRNLKHFIESNARGTASQVRISIERLKNFELLLPPINEQKQVVRILNSYDRAILVNNERIAKLEDLSTELYREWFVRLRFPGYIKTTLVNTMLGRIPDSWKVVNVTDLFSIQYGKAFKSKDFNAQGVGEKIVRIRDINSGQSSTYTTEPSDQRYEVRDGDYLIGMDGEFHQLIWSDGDAKLVQRVARLRAHNPSMPTLFGLFAVGSEIRVLNRSIQGTTVAHLGDTHIQKIKVIIADEDTQGKFNTILEPIQKQLITLRKSNRTLRRVRDILLPKLISGEIKI